MRNLDLLAVATSLGLERDRTDKSKWIAWAETEWKSGETARYQPYRQQIYGLENGARRNWCGQSDHGRAAMRLQNCRGVVVPSIFTRAGSDGIERTPFA